MSLDIAEIIDIFKEYYSFSPLQPGQKEVKIDFSDFSSFNLEIGQELLINSEEIIKCAQLGLEKEENIDMESMSTMSHHIYDNVDIDNMNYVLPDFCINNKIKVVFYLHVKKTATFQEISDRLGIEKSALSKLFSREDVRNGLVDIGLCQLNVMSTKSNSYKLTESGTKYLKDLRDDYLARNKPLKNLYKDNYDIRFYNLPKSCEKEIKDVRSRDLGKLICVKGVVKQASNVRPKTTSAKFECPSCGNTLNVLQLDSKFKEPLKRILFDLSII
jgi:DNA replicative helicase MCM subunit Mcm2 (Cdc46/Mcm family)